MTTTEQIDLCIAELKKNKLKPEYIVIGRMRCVKWMIELSRASAFNLESTKRYNFRYKEIPVVVCESDVLEVVPNAKYMLDTDA